MKIKCILFAVLLAGCISNPPPTPDPHGSNWQTTEYNSGVSVSAPCTFTFPGAGGHVNMLTRQWHTPIPIGSTIVITYKITTISGSPTFVGLDPVPGGGLAPNFRPMLFNGDMADTNARFWPSGTQCGYLIADGQLHTYNIKVDPSLWTNVDGQVNPDGFKSLAHSLTFMDLAFGGGNSFSHGIRCKNGVAQFQLLNLTVK